MVTFSSAQNLFIYNERKRLLQSLINSQTGQENSLIIKLNKLMPRQIHEGDNGRTKYKNSLDEKYIDSHVDELFKFAEELLNAGKRYGFKIIKK